MHLLQVKEALMNKLTDLLRIVFYGENVTLRTLFRGVNSCGFYQTIVLLLITRLTKVLIIWLLIRELVGACI